MLKRTISEEYAKELLVKYFCGYLGWRGIKLTPRQAICCYPNCKVSLSLIREDNHYKDWVDDYVFIQSEYKDTQITNIHYYWDYGDIDFSKLSDKESLENILYTPILDTMFNCSKYGATIWNYVYEKVKFPKDLIELEILVSGIAYKAKPMKLLVI